MEVKSLFDVEESSGKLLTIFNFLTMDSISRRECEMDITYCISGDPTLPHHLQTLLNAQEKFGQPITLALVLNVLKKDRLFSVEESVNLAKKLAEYMGVGFADVVCMETKDKVTKCLLDSDVVIRRKELGLDENSPYIKDMADRYGVSGLPDKIEWIESEHDEGHTSGRLKSLVFVAMRHPRESVRNICREYALKIAPEFIISAIETKITENPDRNFFLSITPDLEEYFKGIK